MNNNKNRLNRELTELIDNTNHPMRDEIEYLRELILSTNINLIEGIKWNGPNYSIGNEDRITIRLYPIKQIQIIFHRGAKKKEQPKEKLLGEKYTMLVWKENDRAVVTFNNLKEIRDNREIFQEIIMNWIKATYIEEL